MSTLIQMRSLVIFAGLGGLNGGGVGDFLPGFGGTISRKGDRLDIFDG